MLENVFQLAWEWLEDKGDHLYIVRSQEFPIPMPPQCQHCSFQQKITDIVIVLISPIFWYYLLNDFTC